MEKRGIYDIENYFAGGEKYLKVITIKVQGEEIDKIEEQKFFKDMVDYLDGKEHASTEENIEVEIYAAPEKMRGYKVKKAIVGIKRQLRSFQNIKIKVICDMEDHSNCKDTLCNMDNP